MLHLEHLCAGYGERRVLDDVGLSVAPGEFLGILGPNGCGKTTLLRTVSGTLAAQGGRVTLFGREIGVIPRRERARSMACLMQDLTLDLAFTVREVVLMGRAPHLTRIGGETRRDHEIADEAMQSADVAHLAERHVTELSGGERQRTLIAMCLAQQPKLLLLDEPTNHLDVGHQLSILDLIAAANRRTGMTVLAVFHDLNLAAEYCGRLLVLDRGRVAAFGPPDKVLTAEMIAQVYGVKVTVLSNPLSQKPHVVVAAGQGAW